MHIKKVIVEDWNKNKTILEVPFYIKKFKWGKSDEPTPHARVLLNQYRSWEVLGEGFISTPVVSCYGSQIKA